MRKLIWLASVLLAGMTACSGSEAHGPPGSRIVGGTTCFEHETADGWKPIGLLFADGTHPVSGAVAAQPVYFPADAGRVRVVPDCSKEAR